MSSSSDWAGSTSARLTAPAMSVVSAQYSCGSNDVKSVLISDIAEEWIRIRQINDRHNDNAISPFSVSAEKMIALLVTTVRVWARAWWRRLVLMRAGTAPSTARPSQ